MKIFKLTFMLLMTVMLFACNAQSSQEVQSAVADNDELQVYYFHFTKTVCDMQCSRDRNKSCLGDVLCRSG